MKPQFIIGSTTSGGGKTTLLLGLLRVLARKGMKVQPFKCGPDFTDIPYHSYGAGFESVNLDTWMASKLHVQYIYNKYAEQTDVCAVEGTMGLFDGFDRMQGSSAEIARLLNIPVILVINARATSYSAAPMLYGFKHFCKSVHIAGVVFNQVSSQAHYAALRTACYDAGLECFGYLPTMTEARLPSRHTGLTSTLKQSLDAIIDRIAACVEQYIDVDKILSLCTRIFPCPYALPYTSETGIDTFKKRKKEALRIAVARDPAFYFVYRETLDRLAACGEVCYFSPVFSNALPEADIVYIPGGYPELFARQIHRRKKLLAQLHDYAENGGKILAEGGGMTLLSHSLTAREEGTAYEMANIFPLDFTMANARQIVGYRRANYRNNELHGYENHFTVLAPTETVLQPEAPVYTARGGEVRTPFYRYKNTIAAQVHWYWGEASMLDLWK